MKYLRYGIVLFLLVFLCLLLILGPATCGRGLKGIIEPVGKGPTWVSATQDRIFISNTISSSLESYFIQSGEFAGEVKDVTHAGFSLYSEVTGMLYVAMGSEGNGSLLFVDPVTLETPRQVDMQQECVGAAVAPDGNFIYAIWGGRKEGPGMITKLAPDGESMPGFGLLREAPTSILVSPDGKKAYVASHFGQEYFASILGGTDEEPGYRSVVEVLDLTDDAFTLIKEIGVGLKPQSMASFGDGRYIIVASVAIENEKLGLPGLSIIDTRTDEVIKKIFTHPYAPFIVVTDEEMGFAYSTFLRRIELPPAENTTPGSEECEPGEDNRPRFKVVQGKGVLAVNLDDFSVSVYESRRGLPLASLCVLDDHRLIGVSPTTNKLVVMEPRQP